MLVQSTDRIDGRGSTRPVDEAGHFMLCKNESKLHSHTCVCARLIADKDMMKQKYWQFSVNELGVMDIKAQIQWIHNVKCDELRGRVPTTTAASTLQMPGVSVGYDVMEDRCLLTLPLPLYLPRSFQCWVLCSMLNGTLILGSFYAVNSQFRIFSILIYQECCGWASFIYLSE